MFDQLHAVSPMWQGRQGQPSVKTLGSPLSAKFCRLCVLSVITQHRALPRHLSEEIKILNILFPRVGMEATMWPGPEA